MEGARGPCGLEKVRQNPRSVKLRDKITGGPRQWLDDVKECSGVSLNEMWREPEDRVA